MKLSMIFISSILLGSLAGLSYGQDEDMELEVLDPDGSEAISPDGAAIFSQADAFAMPKDSPPASVASAEAASAVRARRACTFPKFTYYPGITTTGRFRYGQVDVKFKVCNDDSPTDWDASIKTSYNTLASVQGYNFINAEVRPIKDGGYYRDYEATFTFQDCMPYLAWPCTEKGEFKLLFHAFIERGEPAVIFKKATAPRYWTLYKTQ